MSLAEHVSLQITQDTVGVSRAGFGVPMILSVNAAFPERIRFYSALTDVAADFAVTTSPEYLAAQAMFSQTPKPELIAIGRAVGKPTQRYKVTVSTVENLHVYKLTVRGQGVTTTDVTFTADASALDAEICAGLVIALNAVVGKNFTASGASSPISITGNTPGAWFSVESTEVAYLKIAQDHAEPSPTIAADLTAISNENDSWYAVYTLYNSNACVLATAAAIQPVKKIYIADVSESETVTLAVTGSDTADDLHTSAYSRTAVMYHPSPANMAGAAWLGRVLPLDAGSESWKGKTLAGVTPVTLTGTHRVNLRAKSANTYQTVAGIGITWEGTTSDGDFIDVQRGLDWLEDDMTKAVFEAITGSDKIPYTDQGVAQIQGVIQGSLDLAVARGILAPTPEPAVEVPKVANISAANKALRLLPDIKFSGTLAGAIHKVEIDGVVSV